MDWLSGPVAEVAGCCWAEEEEEVVVVVVGLRLSAADAPDRLVLLLQAVLLMAGLGKEAGSAAIEVVIMIPIRRGIAQGRFLEGEVT